MCLCPCYMLAELEPLLWNVLIAVYQYSQYMKMKYKLPTKAYRHIKRSTEDIGYGGYCFHQINPYEHRKAQHARTTPHKHTNTTTNATTATDGSHEVLDRLTFLLLCKICSCPY